MQAGITGQMIATSASSNCIYIGFYCGLYRGNIGFYRGYTGIMENGMKTTIMLIVLFLLFTHYTATKVAQLNALKM